MLEELTPDLVTSLRKLGSCQACDAGQPLDASGLMHIDTFCQNPAIPTDEECQAVERAMVYMMEHCEDEVAWRAGALAGPCFCAGRFVCDKCKCERELS